MTTSASAPVADPDDLSASTPGPRAPAERSPYDVPLLVDEDGDKREEGEPTSIPFGRTAINAAVVAGVAPVAVLLTTAAAGVGYGGVQLLWSQLGLTVELYNAFLLFFGRVGVIALPFLSLTISALAMGATATAFDGWWAGAAVTVISFGLSAMVAVFLAPALTAGLYALLQTMDNAGIGLSLLPASQERFLYVAAPITSLAMATLFPVLAGAVGLVHGLARDLLELPHPEGVEVDAPPPLAALVPGGVLTE